MEGYLLSKSKRIEQNDFVQNFENSELFSLEQTRGLQSFQSEFQPTQDEAMFGYAGQNTAFQYSQQMRGNFENGHEAPLQCQNHFQTHQTESLYEYNYSSGANKELRPNGVQEDFVDISFESRCTPTACGSLLGLDSINNDFLSQAIDSILMDIPSSEFNFLDSQNERSVLKDELFTTKFFSIAERQCKNTELNDNLFKYDFGGESLKSSSSYINSNTLLNCDFPSQTKPKFETTYRCDTSVKNFQIKDTLLKHKCIITSEKPFQYDICQRKPSQMGQLSEYKNSLTLLETDLKRHMLTQNAAPIQNDLVDERNSLKLEQLTRQVRTHLVKKTYQCNECKKEFSRQSNLTQHIRTHTGEKPYQCNVCNRKFSVKQNLIHHMLTHTGQKPYHCDVCKKSFSLKGNLNTHMRTHTGEKPFQCHLCKQKFSQAASLSRHMHTHTVKKCF